jgi:pimeloyl-ACP methyl ester carboxylesterase
MVFFWQFPQRVERLALVSSGGLGREVSPLLRAAALPGASALLRAAAEPRVLDVLERVGDGLDARRPGRGVPLRAIVRALQPLQDPGARAAFLHTLRSVIDIRGQRVSAVDRLYLLASVPCLIVWGERDRTIPIEHGRAAHEAVPHSQFRTLPRAAHFPHLEDPEGLADALAEFIETTTPHRIDDAEWSEVLESRAPRRRHLWAA